MGAAIARTCALARYLERCVASIPELELMAPVELNIVCFRYRAPDADQLNRQIVIELQESGIVAPSTTVLDGRVAIRAAIVNHRTSRAEIYALVEETLRTGRSLCARIAGHDEAEQAHPIAEPQMKHSTEAMPVFAASADRESHAQPSCV
jgi:glutamate/tyrosine decarboxylase-like PLP-dependent enzyme